MVELKDTQSPSLIPLVGNEIYAAWIQMLKTLVPVDRANRVKSMVAAMLQYAYLQRGKASAHEAGILLGRAREPGPGDPLEILFPVLESLFRDAGFSVRRAENPGRECGPVYDAIREFIIWEDRSWE